MPILVKEGSIVPLGPVVQSASGPQKQLEIRVYGGKDASFDLYEDGGDGYAYEKGSRATIYLQWDDRRKTLSIGDRKGSYPGLLAKRTLQIVLVKPGHGAGDQSTSSVDRSVQYEGHAMTINLGEAN
jgi:alpha-D-xyloside xylohydrolase